MDVAAREPRPPAETSALSVRYNMRHANPARDSRPEVHVSDHFSQERRRRVATPVWFGEKDDKLYVMTRSDSGKYKRIRNNPQVRDRSLHHARQDYRTRSSRPSREFFLRKTGLRPRKTIQQKYWLTRIPFFWSKTNVYLEIEISRTEPSAVLSALVRFAICRILRFPVTIFFPSQAG